MCNKNEAIEILAKACVQCKSVFGELKTAYLYGSYARGDFHSESDVDILLTVDKTQEQISKCRMAVADISSALSLEYDVTVSIAVKPAEQFEKYQNVLPFYRNVIKEGIKYAG